MSAYTRNKGASVLFVMGFANRVFCCMVMTSIHRGGVMRKLVEYLIWLGGKLKPRPRLPGLAPG